MNLQNALEKMRPYRSKDQRRVASSTGVRASSAGGQSSSAAGASGASVDFGKHDREQLEKEQHDTKQVNNLLEKKIVKLKTKIQMLYQELTRKDRLIEQFISNTVPDRQIQDSYIVNAYKSQILELQRRLDEQEEEKEKIQKSLPVTQNQELQVEVEVYKQECFRLRKMMDAMMTENEMNKMFSQDSWRAVDMEDKQKDSKLIENEKEMQLMRQTIEEQDQNNLELIQKLNEMAIVNHKLSSGGKAKGAKGKSNKGVVASTLKQLEDAEN
jgi:hypothetical protein